MGGFGETSTDMTLPRTLKKKRILDVDYQETRFISHPNGFIASQNSIYSHRPAIFSSINENLDKNDNHFPTNGVIPNGHVNASDSGRGSSESGGPPSPLEDDDRHSMATIDAADCALDQSNGVQNPVFENDPDELDCSKSSKPSPDKPAVISTPPTPMSGANEALINSQNMHLFAYENIAMQNGLPKREGGQMIDPPAEFRDMSSEPSVAVVQPSVIKENGGLSWLHKDRLDREKEDAQRAVPSSRNGTGDSLSTGAAVAYSNWVPPGTAVVYSTGGVPPVSSNTDSAKETFTIPLPRSNYSYNNASAGQKPSAHVQPQRKGDH